MRENGGGHIQSAVLVAGHDVLFDIRYVGDGYVDERWAADVLERRERRTQPHPGTHAGRRGGGTHNPRSSSFLRASLEPVPKCSRTGAREINGITAQNLPLFSSGGAGAAVVYLRL